MNFCKRIFALLLVFCIVNIYTVQLKASTSDEEFRAIWVGTVQGLNYPSKATTDENLLKNDAIKILDYVKDMGFNAVIFQVRPACDAFYKSNIFPWSKYLTGTQGLAPNNDFDPLEFFIEEAHARGLQLHAWINPYRITANKSENPYLATRSPAVLNPDLTVKYKDGKLYWNPGEPEARKIVLEGVQEIVDNYDVDGIHIDDYFYPGADFNDSSTYEMYKGSFDDIDNWRRDNNNQLVKSMYDIVHNSGKDIVFGVSPSGIWANKSSQSLLGSNTNGSQSYYELFADSRGWVKNGYIDYIIPQIYWNIGFKVADYEELCNWWSDVVKDTNVKLYIGQAAYKTGNSNQNNPWYGVEEIKRQVEFNRSNDLIDGYAMFSYSSFTSSPDLYNLIKELNHNQNLIEN